MSAFYLILITLSVSSIAAYFYTNHQVMSAKTSLDAISERQERATSLWDDWQSLQYEMRGYIVFGDDAVLETVDEKKTIAGGTNTVVREKRDL